MNQTVLRLTLLVGLLIGIVLAVLYRDTIDVPAIQIWIESSGTIAPIIFILMYIVATLLFLPGLVMTLLGGALFGPVWGVFYNLMAATIGAVLSFLVARYLASDWVTQKSSGRLKQVINGVEQEGWRFVAFVRLVPLFPFNLLNYALGLTKIKTLEYSLATFICMLPGAIAYTYLGYIGREAATGGQGLVQKGILAFALLAVIAFLPRLINNIRKGPMIDIPHLKQRLDAEDDMLLLDVRTEVDYLGEQGHIDESTLIPLEQLEQRIDELHDYRDKTIVTICRTDRKSAKAAQILAKNNFANVFVAKMGMTEWNQLGYPTK